MSNRDLYALFGPRRIAIVGASNRPRSIGNILVRNLLRDGYAGAIWPVNPHEQTIEGLKCFGTVEALPKAPDLAVIATPPPTVPGIVAALTAKRCRSAVVISAGLRRSPGRADDVAPAATGSDDPHPMRVVGPNCLGVISPRAQVNVSFAERMPRAGTIALVSQSGAVVAAVLDWANERGIGFSRVVSLGEASDVDFGDILTFLAADPETRSILLHAESIGSAAKFLWAARNTTRHKPIFAIKAGRSSAGAEAARTHSGAMAGADAVYDAAFRQAGIVRVERIADLLDVAALLAAGSEVASGDLVILTNGGGAGVLALDALEAEGCAPASLREEDLAALEKVLPASWSRSNPIDILGDADRARYGAALKGVLAHPRKDAVLVIHCPTAVADGLDVARSVAEIGESQPDRTILANWLGGAAAGPGRALLSSRRIPSFDTPEAAVRAYSFLARRRRRQVETAEPPKRSPVIDEASIVAAKGVLEDMRSSGARAWLTDVEAKQLLELAGIPVVRTMFAREPAAIQRLAEEIAGPLALKIVSPDVVHKSEMGGVRLNVPAALAGAEAARMAEAISRGNPSVRIEGFAIEPMIVRPNARELIVGIATDPTFGPVVLFGSGGKTAEIVRDRSIGLPPLNAAFAASMIERTRISKLLRGYRDVPPVAMERVIDVLLRLSELALRLPDIAELDVNPLLADASGVLAIDTRIRLADKRDGSTVVDRSTPS